jgi:uncharacterized protein YjbI with pentapeptide repeats
VAGDEPIELSERTWHGERLGPVDFAASSELVELTLTECDVVGVLADKSRLERVSITDSRLRGTSWAGGVVRGVVLDNVTGTDVSFRFSTLRSVTIRDSRIPELDFTNVEFEQVVLQRCSLPGAVFDHARVKSLRIEACDLAGATGIINLRGASMDLEGVLSVAPDLARELGIQVE